MHFAGYHWPNSWSQVKLLSLEPLLPPCNKASQRQACADHVSQQQSNATDWLCSSLPKGGCYWPSLHAYHGPTVVVFKPSHQMNWFPWAKGHPIRCNWTPISDCCVAIALLMKETLVCLAFSVVLLKLYCQVSTISQASNSKRWKTLAWYFAENPQASQALPQGSGAA